jgi:hypothetical protein
MSVLPFTFYNYIMSSKNGDVKKFKEIFGDRIEKMPDKIVSSRMLMMLLEVELREEYDIFRNVYMEYFKKKVLGNII